MNPGPEPRQYTAGEIATLAMLTARLAARGCRNQAAIGRRIEQVKASAVAREAAEEKARAAAETKRIEARAARRAARTWF